MLLLKDCILKQELFFETDVAVSCKYKHKKKKHFMQNNGLCTWDCHLLELTNIHLLH